MAIEQLTDKEIKNISRQAKNELSKRYFRDYLETTHLGNYQHFPHTDLITKYLQRIADGEQLDLLIEMPPR